MIYTAIVNNKIIAMKSRRRLKRLFPEAKEIILRHTNEIDFARLQAYEALKFKNRVKNAVKSLWLQIRG